MSDLILTLLNSWVGLFHTEFITWILVVASVFAVLSGFIGLIMLRR